MRVYTLRVLGFLVSVAFLALPINALAQTRFAAIGDYGDSPAATKVANLIKSRIPAFIITVGDNCYDLTPLATQVGKNYGTFVNQRDFWPTLGNHEYSDPCGGGAAKAYFDYFTLPNNERYYDFVIGPVHFFALNSNIGEKDGTRANSRQARWLKRKLAEAREPWKIVYFHHAPFSSGIKHGSTARMQWPFESWGANLVVAGHDHHYERLLRDDNKDGRKLTYIVDGLGGRPPRGFAATPVAGSVFRYNADNGALFVTATSTSLLLEFRAASSGTVVDRYEITKGAQSTTQDAFEFRVPPTE